MSFHFAEGFLFRVGAAFAQSFCVSWTITAVEAMADEPLFTEVATDDFLDFAFGGRKYADQIAEAVKKTKQFCAVQVTSKSLSSGDTSIKVVW